MRSVCRLRVGWDKWLPVSVVWHPVVVSVTMDNIAAEPVISVDALDDEQIEDLREQVINELD